MTTHCKILKDRLLAFSPGEISDIGEITGLLANAWEEMPGSDSQGMKAEKLFNRVETPTWASPYLTFIIERHGATVVGSTHADLHRWTIDTRNMTASCESAGRRQLYEMDARLDTKPLVAQAARLIQNREEHEWVKWVNTNLVRIHVAKVIPETVKETTSKRRRRFRTQLADALSGTGWSSPRANVFEYNE